MKDNLYQPIGYQLDERLLNSGSQSRAERRCINIELLAAEEVEAFTHNITIFEPKDYQQFNAVEMARWVTGECGGEKSYFILRGYVKISVELWWEHSHNYAAYRYFKAMYEKDNNNKYAKRRAKRYKSLYKKAVRLYKILKGPKRR